MLGFDKLSSLRRNVKSETGIDIEVYHQDIFDLLLDYYEEEYLLKFTEPRTEILRMLLI